MVEEDLVEGLTNGHLYGAGLDVTEFEPLAPESKLWDLPNLVLTPHVGGQSERRAEQITDFFCRNLESYQAGQPMANLVDKRLGFPHRYGTPA